MGSERTSPLSCWGQARNQSSHGQRHLETYLNQLDEARKVEFLKILWEYGFQSTVVSFQGPSEYSSLKSS